MQQMAEFLNRSLASPDIGAPRSLREDLLEFSVHKPLSYPFLPPPYHGPVESQHIWASDMVRWFGSHTQHGVACGEFLSEVKVKAWFDKAILNMAYWADDELEEVFKVTKAVVYYQTVHRITGAVYLKARNLQPDLQRYLQPVACSTFHGVTLLMWDSFIKASYLPQVSDILCYPEGVAAMMASGFVAPISPSWFELGYPPSAADGQPISPYPMTLGESPPGTALGLVAVPVSWLTPHGNSMPMKCALEFMKPDNWDLEQWMTLTADQKKQVIAGVQSSSMGEDRIT